MSQIDLVWRRDAEDGSADSDASPVDLRLVTPVRESTWLGLDPDGRSVTARRLGELPDPGNETEPGDEPAAQELADVIERAAALASLRAPSLVRTLGVQRANGALWLVSELDDGVWLSRLLELTRPSPAQVVVVSLGVLSGLRAVHAAGYAHGSLCAAEVRVGVDGQARLDGWAAGALRGTGPLEQQQQADLAAMGVLLVDLARAARRSPASADQGAPALLAALDAAAGCAAHSGADAELVAAPLEAACGPDEDAATRSELAALAQAVATGGSASTSGVTPRPLPAPGAQQHAVDDGAVAPARRREGRTDRLGARLRVLWMRTWTWIVALTVLAAVVSLEFVLLHDRLAQDVQRLQTAGDRPEQQPTASPVTLPPIPSPAPPSAGVIGGLDLRAVEPCTPGTMCTVRVLVQLHPQPQDRRPRQVARQAAPRVVRWNFQVVDRCTGGQHSVPGGVVSVAPGGDQVQAVSTVALPPGHALGVIAVTSEPAMAASGPLLVPTRQGACPES